MKHVDGCSIGHQNEFNTTRIKSMLIKTTLRLFVDIPLCWQGKQSLHGYMLVLRLVLVAVHVLKLCVAVIAFNVSVVLCNEVLVIVVGFAFQVLVMVLCGCQHL